MSVLPKIQNKYCNRCKKYNPLRVTIVKSRSPGALKKINRRKELKYLTKGPGGKFSKTPAKSTKMCKKYNLLLTCTVCEAKRNWARRRSVKLILK